MNIGAQLKSIHKFSCFIEEASDKYGVSKDILMAIAVLENINRPPWFRLMENLCARIFHHEMTLGLMQVRSAQFITDRQSIFMAAKILSTYKRKSVSELGELYNGSKEYGDCLDFVVKEIGGWTRTQRG